MRRKLHGGVESPVVGSNPGETELERLNHRQIDLADATGPALGTPRLGRPTHVGETGRVIDEQKRPIADPDI